MVINERGQLGNLIYIDYESKREGEQERERERSKVHAGYHTITTVQIVGGYPGGAGNSRQVMLACKSCSPTDDALVGSFLHMPTANSHNV